MKASYETLVGLHRWSDTLKESEIAGTGEYVIRRRKTVTDENGPHVAPADDEDTEFIAVYVGQEDGTELWVADFADYDDAAAFALLRGEARRGW